MEVINTTGRRKTSVARIFLKEGRGIIIVNGRKFRNYFPIPHIQKNILQPLELLQSLDKFDIKANIHGGGITGQAGALRLAISRALVKYNSDNKPILKKKGLLTRDSRMVERKKAGQKKARKRFQFTKR